MRAGLVVWGAWLLVTALTFSFMAGIFHAYYTVALAPAIAALVGTGAWLLWERRDSLLAMGIASGTVSLTAVLGFALLERSPDFLPWLRYLVLVAGLGSALLLAGVRFLPRRVALAVGAAALVATLAGPAAYAVDTAATPHTGSIPSAGPPARPGSGQGQGPPGGPAGPGGGTADAAAEAVRSEAACAAAPPAVCSPAASRRRRSPRCSSRTRQPTTGPPPRSAPTRPPATSSRRSSP